MGKELKGLRKRESGSWIYQKQIDGRRFSITFENHITLEKALEQNPELRGMYDDDIEVRRVIDISKKDGIKFYLEGENDWVLVRFSGTEPLLRIYFESLDAALMENAYKEVAMLVGV